MCGIAGIVSRQGFDPGVLMAMTHLVKYRGPDGYGFAYAGAGTGAAVEIVHDENRLPKLSRPLVGLGSRRLAILDLSPLGNMPMEIESGDFSIVFNGEIYNYKEVREELRVCGHRFRTGTDTEVILRAYQEWGERCLERFNGMWSFAIWDRREQKLFCSRDRFGVKPFYYAVYGQSLYFGSEIKQVLQASGIDRHANPRTVFPFLEWGLLGASAETFFDGVYQLPAGYTLSLGLSEPTMPIIRQYWKLQVEPGKVMSVKDATEEFRARFELAVKLRLRSDVPVGVSLSGGLDSSAILCQAKQLAPGTQFHTFSACFEEKAIDEREYIAAVIAATGGAGHVTFPRAQEFWQAAQSIVYHQDEPLGSTSVFPQWCVMEDARKNGFPVVLGGQGGDEILCGYQKYRYFYLWHLLRHGDPKLFRETLCFARNTTTDGLTMASATRYLPAVLGRRFSVTRRLCNAAFRNSCPSMESNLGAAASIGERQITDLTYTSIPALLRHEDRNSMAHSVESRLPFLDYQLAQFAVNCPASLKIRDGWSKWILRNALTGTLPEKVRLRKTKLGFNTPEADWMRSGLQNGHRDLWDTPRLKMDRILSGASLIQECKKFLQGSGGTLPANWLFRALSLELWATVHMVS
jgi:asparagine synthase (glutamine-hydrolysing)